MDATKKIKKMLKKIVFFAIVCALSNTSVHSVDSSGYTHPNKVTKQQSGEREEIWQRVCNILNKNPNSIEEEEYVLQMQKNGLKKHQDSNVEENSPDNFLPQNQVLYANFLEDISLLDNIVYKDCYYDHYISKLIEKINNFENVFNNDEKSRAISNAFCNFAPGDRPYLKYLKENYSDRIRQWAINHSFFTCVNQGNDRYRGISQNTREKMRLILDLKPEQWLIDRGILDYSESFLPENIKFLIYCPNVRIDRKVLEVSLKKSIKNLKYEAAYSMRQWNDPVYKNAFLNLPENEEKLRAPYNDLICSPVLDQKLLEKNRKISTINILLELLENQKLN